MPGRRQVYLSPPPSQDPLLVDLDGRRTFIPTGALWAAGHAAGLRTHSWVPRASKPRPVYGLWRAPALLPTLLVFAPATRRLLNGADVMLAGVRFPPDAQSLLEAVASGRSPAAETPFLLPAGAFVAIRAVGNPAPVAVAKLLLSTAQMAERLLLGSAGGAPQGKAADVVHIYKDELWGKGTRSRPNDGFLPTGVTEVDEEAGTMGGPGGLVVGAGGGADARETSEATEPAADGEPEAEREETASARAAAPKEAVASSTGAASAAGTAGGDGADSHDRSASAEREKEGEEEDSEEDQDRLLIASLCQVRVVAFRSHSPPRPHPPALPRRRCAWTLRSASIPWRRVPSSRPWCWPTAPRARTSTSSAPPSAS